MIHGKKRIYYFLMTVVLSIGFYGAKGGVHSLVSGGGNNIYGPEGSFIGSNNTIGLALCMILPLTVFFAREEKRIWFKRLLWAVAVLSAIATIFTYSRGAMLGLATVLILMFMRSKAKLWALFVFIPLAYLGYQWAPDKIFKRAGQIETFEQDNSAMQRLQAWSVAWNLAKDFPLTGAGFEYEYSPNEERWLSYADRKYDAFGQKSRAVHSSYLEVLGQHGYIAWVLFLLMLILMLKRLNRLRKIGSRYPELAWVDSYAEGILISMAGFLITGLFVNAAYFDLMYAYLMMTAILQREVNLHIGPQPFSAARTAHAIPTKNQPI